MLTVLHCVNPQILTDDNSALIFTDFFQSADFHRLLYNPLIFTDYVAHPKSVLIRIKLSLC